MDNFENNGFETEQPETVCVPYQQEQPKPPRKKLPFWLGLVIGIASMLVVSGAAAIVIGLIAIGGSRSIDLDYKDKLDLIFSYIDKYYINDIDEDAMENSIAKGVLDGLGDKYAAYYSPEEYASFMEGMSGEYAGIGVSIIMNADNMVEVYKVFAGTPADEAGIIVGDLIVQANDVTSFETLDDLVQVVRGEPGTTVDLVLDRNGEKINVTVERRKIAMETVVYRMINDRIGYIQITEFDAVTDEQFDEALIALEQEGMQALILDLRDNPGGDYATVVNMCKRILPKGPIVTVEDKNGTIDTENSDGSQALTIPLAVLINGNSASASEVFTGAIQDYHMATIIGETSFGKGIVQSIFTLPDGSGMKFTTQKYFTPSGDSIDGVGITPDIEVHLPEDAYDDGVLTEDEDTQLQKAIEVLTLQ